MRWWLALAFAVVAGLTALAVVAVLSNRSENAFRRYAQEFAVGNTVAASGSYASYTKPASIPYLNLFCDPDAFKCNDPATLAYIKGDRVRDTRQVYNEANATIPLRSDRPRTP